MAAISPAALMLLLIHLQKRSRSAQSPLSKDTKVVAAQFGPEELPHARYSGMQTACCETWNPTVRATLKAMSLLPCQQCMPASVQQQAPPAKVSVLWHLEQCPTMHLSCHNFSVRVLQGARPAL